MWGFERLDPVRTSENSPKKRRLNPDFADYPLTFSAVVRSSGFSDFRNLLSVFG